MDDFNIVKSRKNEVSLTTFAMKKLFFKSKFIMIINSCFNYKIKNKYESMIFTHINLEIINLRKIYEK